MGVNIEGARGVALIELLRERRRTTPGMYYEMFWERFTAAAVGLTLEEYFKVHTPVRHYPTTAYFVPLLIWLMEAAQAGDMEKGLDLAASGLVFGEQTARDNGKVQFPWSLTLLPPEP